MDASCAVQYLTIKICGNIDASKGWILSYIKKFFDIRYILAIPAVYRIFYWVIGGYYLRDVLMKSYIKPREGERVLDVGCGPGDILDYLPKVEYIGIEHEAKYVDAAERKYGSHGTFLHKDIKNVKIDEFRGFDLVLAIGILHHLDDAKGEKFFNLAWSALKEGGRLICFDGCYEENQSWLKRKLLLMDRGKYVRTKEGYLNLARRKFTFIKTYIRQDLLRMPYTHIIMECRKTE